MNLWEKIKSRTVVYGTGSVAAVVLVAGILAGIILLGHTFSWRLDLTREKSHSLSPVSLSLLQEVQKPLTMTAFYPEAHGERQRAREVLELYSQANPQVSYKFSDPEKDPVSADQAGARFVGNVLLEYDGRRQMAERPEEQEISEALRRILKKERKKIYFLSGHGERSGEQLKRGYQTAWKALQNEGYEVNNLNLLTEAEIPQGTAVVILAAPKKDLLPQEVAALKNYLEGGGRLFIMLEPFYDAGLKDFLAGYGVGLDNGVVLQVSPLSREKAILWPIVNKYGTHAITRNFALATLFPEPRALLLNEEMKTVALTPLVTTSQASWEKTGKDWQKNQQAMFDPKADKRGPFTLAVVVEPKIDKKTKGSEPQPVPPQPYVVVFGDADFAADEFFNQLGNGDLFLNTVNFLAMEEKQIAIRKNPARTEALPLTSWHYFLIFSLTLVILPVGLLSAGVAAYVRRRRARR